MLNLKIEQGDVKEFMGALLMSEKFDCLEVRGVDVTTFTHFNISGQKIVLAASAAAEEDDENEAEEVKVKAVYCKWMEIRPIVHSFIKGGAKPSYMKIIFSIGSDEALKIHENGAAMYLNVAYNGEEVFFTSATAQRGFSLDKSLDHVWEDYLVEFFRVNAIKAQEIAME